MTHRIMVRSALSLFTALLLCLNANAQLFRAYLSPAGNDANPCTLPSPCRLLPAALSAVADGGEIWMLDSANYNTATVIVTKSVTILAVPGALGSVVAIGGPAIILADVAAKVALRNLVIGPFPGGGGTFGIHVSDGASLTVDECLVANLPASGILVTTPATLRITDSTIRDNAGDGLHLSAGSRATIARTMISGNGNGGIYVSGAVASTTTTADVAGSTVDGNTIGVGAISENATAVVKVSVRDSRAVRNVFGLAAQSTAGAVASLSASNNMVSNNSDSGIVANFAGSKVWASGNTVSDNATGIINNGGLVESTGNNAVRNNGTNTSGTISPVPEE